MDGIDDAKKRLGVVQEKTKKLSEKLDLVERKGKKIGGLQMRSVNSRRPKREIWKTQGRWRKRWSIWRRRPSGWIRARRK